MVPLLSHGQGSVVAISHNTPVQKGLLRPVNKITVPLSYCSFTWKLSKYEIESRDRNVSAAWLQITDVKREGDQHEGHGDSLCESGQDEGGGQANQIRGIRLVDQLRPVVSLEGRLLTPKTIFKIISK